METSSENLHEDIFWVKKLKMSDRDDVVNSNGWLNDRLINFAQNLLKSECNVNGLQDTLFAPHYDEKKNRWIINDYVKKQTAPSCQIHYNGNNHWICSYQKEENGPVYLLDSLKSSRTLNANVSIQISQIYNINTDNITVHIPDVQRQQNSHDCGVYAIAFITELICSDFNVDISNTQFMTSLMRTHLLKCIEENNISVFPKVAKMPKMPCNEPKITKIKLYCKCKMPEFIDSSVYLGILGQAFYSIFPHFSPFFQSRTTFQILLNILKHAFRYIIQLLHRMIYSTYSSKSSQLNSISLKLFKVFKEFRVISNIYI